MSKGKNRSQMMPNKTLSMAILFALSSTPVLAESNGVEQRIQQLEQHLQRLEQKLQQQEQALQAKDEQINSLQQTQTAPVQKAASSSADSGSEWFGKLEVSGVVELELAHHKPYEGESTNDFSVATVELGLSADINPWIKGEIVLLYEEDDTPLDIDVATLRISPPEAAWYILAGRMYAPFGTFESYMVSDPFL